MNRAFAGKPSVSPTAQFFFEQTRTEPSGPPFVMLPEHPTEAMMENPKAGHRELSAEEARPGYIVLRTSRNKTVFIAGLVGFVGFDLAAILLT